MRASFRVESATRFHTAQYFLTVGAFPRLHLKYSTFVVKSKHFFRKFTNYFISYVQNVKCKRQTHQISKNVLTQTKKYDKIIFGGRVGRPFFYLHAPIRYLLCSGEVWFLSLLKNIINLLTLFLKWCII